MDRADIQGIALHAYRRRRFARYHLLRFGMGEPRAWLTRLVGEIASADEPRAIAPQNLALSAPGLRALGLGDPELAQFCREFRQGMAHPERARALRDTGDDAPERWEFGGSSGLPLDALLMTFADTEALLLERSAVQERAFERFGIVWQAQDAELCSAGHFGTTAQSGELAGQSGRKSRRSKRLPLGELLLGSRDAAGERVSGPFVPLKFGARPLPAWSKARGALDFGQNGSYLVLRKLEQNVAALRAKFGAQSRAELAALHARRARGPEPAGSHRLVRRSRRYGSVFSEDRAHEPRGLWFMALNADIRRQFEFVIQNYLKSAPAAAEASDSDPFSTPGLVRVRGGGYFFLPSICALNYLAERAG